MLIRQAQEALGDTLEVAQHSAKQNARRSASADATERLVALTQEVAQAQAERNIETQALGLRDCAERKTQLITQAQAERKAVLITQGQEVFDDLPVPLRRLWRFLAPNARESKKRKAPQIGSSCRNLPQRQRENNRQGMRFAEERKL